MLSALPLSSDHDFGLQEGDELGVCSRCGSLVRRLPTPQAISIGRDPQQTVVEYVYSDGGRSPWWAEASPCKARGEEGYIPWWYWTTRRRRPVKSTKSILATVLALSLSL